MASFVYSGGNEGVKYTKNYFQFSPEAIEADNLLADIDNLNYSILSETLNSNGKLSIAVGVFRLDYTYFDYRDNGSSVSFGNLNAEIYKYGTHKSSSKSYGFASITASGNTVGYFTKLEDYDYETGIKTVVNGTFDYSKIGGTSYQDYLYYVSGNDTFQLTNFADELDSGPGNDVIYGNGGNDILDGESGSDIINGGDGSDVIRGGTGGDSITPGKGNDDVDGGSGVDEVWFSGKSSDYQFSGSSSYLTVKDIGSGSNDGTDTLKNIENLRFTDGLLTTNQSLNLASNSPPTNIYLSSGSFNENISSGSKVASLTAIDTDSSDTHTYTLVNGYEDSTDNGYFTISGNSLKIKSSPNYEEKSSYTIAIKATDNYGNESDVLGYTLKVNDLPEGNALTRVDFASIVWGVNENIPAGSTIAILEVRDRGSYFNQGKDAVPLGSSPTNDSNASSTNISSNETTFSFSDGYEGSWGNQYFFIEGNELKIKESPDYEKLSSYDVTIISTDKNGFNSPATSFNLTVNDLDEGNAPTDWRMSDITFNENIPTGTVIASLSAVDKDPLDSHTFRFVESPEFGADNKYFSIEGDQMKINHSPDFETKFIYQIQFEAIDNTGLSTGPLWTFLGVNNLEEPINTITNSSDIINGTDGSDEINSLAGADEITGGEGDDVIDGGIGSDTSIYSGEFADYSFRRVGKSLKVTDIRSDINDGIDTLTNIEYLQFTDQTIDSSKVDITKSYSKNFRDYKFYKKENGTFEIKTETRTDDITGIPKLTFADKTTGISAISEVKGVFDQVTGMNTDSGQMFRLYNAAFARFPDSDGLNYWINKYSSGENDSRAVAQSFLASNEFAERYGANVTDEKYVTTLYQNVLGRAPDTSGLNYWLGQLSSGAETRYEALLGFAESAENKALFTEMTGFG